jgi:DNA primase
MGRNVGFGGRMLGSGEPKYLNSPESPVFSKGKLLYGMNWAKNDVRREDRVLVAEGFFDVVRLMAAGVTTVVAPLGTALTDAQAALLKKLTKNVFLLYDSDKAGLKATFRSGDELLRQGVSVRVVTLPEGDDPDTFVRAHGAAGLMARLADAIDVFERKIQLLDRAGWFGELQKKRRALDRLLPTIRATSDELMRDLYVSRASEVTGVAREVLDRELRGKSSPPPEGGGGGGGGGYSQTAPRIAPPSAARVRRADRRVRYTERGASAEKELIRAILMVRTRLESIGEKIGEEIFRDPHYRSIYRAMKDAGADATIEQLSSHLDEHTVATIEQLLAEDATQMDPDRTISDSIATLLARNLDQRLAEIDGLVPLANDTEKNELIAEKQKIMKELQGAGQKHFKAFRQRRSR